MKIREVGPHWMPPEIMKGSNYEMSSDVYSYIIILWEFLTWEIPYYGLIPNQILGLVADCKKIVEVPKVGHVAVRKLVKNCLIYESEKKPSFDYIISYLDKVLYK
jgi:serine/threonine protein kinase